MANPRRKKVKFTDKKHAKKGIAASILAVLAVGLMAAGILVSYSAKGNAGNIVGILGFISIVIAIIGFILGVVSYKEKDRYYLFSGVGSILNALLLVLWLSIYIRGFYGF